MGVPARQPRSTFNSKLILWQYDALMRSPVKGVNAAPLEDNILEWHGNIYFPEDHEWFPGMVVHFILHLPDDFPNSTPDMRLLSSFPHSHVFGGGSICFSLLEEFQWYFRYDETTPGTAMWNPARSIRSLLESVYIFLTVDEDQHRTITAEGARLAMKNAREYWCDKCGHNHYDNYCWPPEEQWMAACSSSAATAADGMTNNHNEQQVCALAMYEDLTDVPPAAATDRKKPVAVVDPHAMTLAEKMGLVDRRPVFPGLPADGRESAQFENRVALLKSQADEMVSILSSSSSTPAAAPSAAAVDNATADTSAVMMAMMEDFRCSMTGVSFDHSDKVVLGFGIDVQRRTSDGSILSITTDLEPISFEIFHAGNIRKSALGSKITHFFPFGINESHWKKAQQVLPGCVDAILGTTGPELKTLKTPEDRLLFVVGELWKSMAVLMMKGETHTSEKVLKGFCSLHHLLLLATNEPNPVCHDPQNNTMPPVVTPTSATRPGETWAIVAGRSRKSNNTKPQNHQNSAGGNMLRPIANHQVRGFVTNPGMRLKSVVPDFGRFLPLMLLSDLRWDQMRGPFVGELLARNARWIVKAHRPLQYVGHKERTAVSSSERATKSWGPSATGLKLAAFQIRFALNVVPWARSAVPADVAEPYWRSHKPHLLVRAMYNRLGGRPTAAMLQRFQTEAKQIEALTNFSDFFKMINMPRSDLDIQIMLCDAMINSKKAGYHY